MKIREDVELGQHSHVGMTRTENQDFFGYWESDDDREFDLRGRLAVVCDGMGGHSGGEIASRMAVEAIIDSYKGATQDNVSEALRASIESANHTVYSEGVRLKELAGMGTTVTALVQRRGMVYFGQVGDSRAYLIRGGQMKQMTKDHSLVQQLVDEGLLEESEMENHPDKNVILRSLGVKPEVEVDVSHIPIAKGDTFLICSDGLSGLISNDEMLEIYTKGEKSGKSLRGICEEMIDGANAAGGHDNSTVQLLRVVATETSTTDSTPEGTVTQSFDEDEVKASIEKARSEAAEKAAAVAGPPKTPLRGLPSVASPDKSPDAGMPVTKPAMPVPKLSGQTTPPEASGPKPALLVGLGLVIGLAIGAGGVFVANGSATKGAATRAQQAAQGALTSATAGKLKDRAARLNDEGKSAFAAGRFEEARAKFEAAASVAELTGGGQ
ncbi:MAG: Stp1/IreP family PP2C-type Ser/Thr phosphatase [Planctomycetes bacterium]|nr:Stp1/IreP family PP2C-type Ser/Thr phosphatase [Planctomycetota bacterium]